MKTHRPITTAELMEIWNLRHYVKSIEEKMVRNQIYKKSGIKKIKQIKNAINYFVS